LRSARIDLIGAWNINQLLGRQQRKTGVFFRSVSRMEGSFASHLSHPVSSHRVIDHPRSIFCDFAPKFDMIGLVYGQILQETLRFLRVFAL